MKKMRFMNTEEFASAVCKSDNYVVLITRENLYNLLTVSKRYMACIHRENTRIQEKCISKCIRFIPIWKMFQ